MKFMLKGVAHTEAGVFSRAPGVRCDAIQLDARDLRVMYDMLNNGSDVCIQQMKEVLSNWQCRFVPTVSGAS